MTDRALAIGLVAAGIGGIVVAFALRPHPFDMSPAMDGVYTCGLLGFILPLLHGIGWRRALHVALPIVCVQLVCFVGNRVMAPAPLGVQALLAGVIGIVATTSHTASRGQARADAAEPTRGNG